MDVNVGEEFDVTPEYPKAELTPKSTAEERFVAMPDSARSGDVATLRTLVEGGIDPDRPDDREVADTASGVTALMYAASDGQLEAAKALIDLGADVDIQTDAGTALIVSSLYGHDDIASTLLESGASVDKSSRDVGTPLIAAAQRGYAQVVDVLLEAGADVNFARKDDGVTALMMAALGATNYAMPGSLDYHAPDGTDYPAVVRSLLKAGASTQMQTKEGGTAIHAAGQSNQTELLTLIKDAALEQAHAMNKRRVDEAAKKLRSGGAGSAGAKKKPPTKKKAKKTKKKQSSADEL